MELRAAGCSNLGMTFPRLFLLFACVPLIDLFLLFRIGAGLGFWPTLALVLLTGVVGAALARAQGIRTIIKIHTELAAGHMPADELADGAMILLAAALLVTPGFLTDVVGVALLVPWCRRVARRVLSRHFGQRVSVMHIGLTPAGEAPFSEPTDSGAPSSLGDGMKYVRNESRDGRPTGAGS